MKTSRFAAIALFTFILFAGSGSFAGEKKAHEPKGNASVVNDKLRSNGEVLEGDRVLNAKNPGVTKFDPRRYDRQLKTLKKIVRQRIFAQRLQKAIQKARHERKMKRMTAFTDDKKVKLFGKPTRFVPAPPSAKQPKQSPMALRGAHPTAFNVQVNGKTQDTIFVGDPFTLTFSFAPGNISALLNVYLDADSNGNVSEGDFSPLETNLLMLDNDDNDMNPANGVYQLQFYDTDLLNEVVSTLIFEVNDFQSVSTAVLTVRQRPASS